MNLVYNIDDINTYRVNEVRDILKNVSGNNNLFIDQFSTSGNVVIAVANNRDDRTKFTSWKFSTYRKNLIASYYEIWKKMEENKYYLFRLYLHLYNTDEEYNNHVADSEYVLLHCDPNEPEDQAHSKYKRSPHLHIKSAFGSLPHSHLALNLNDLNKILSSRVELNQAFDTATKLLKDQILDE